MCLANPLPHPHQTNEPTCTPVFHRPTCRKPCQLAARETPWPLALLSTSGCFFFVCVGYYYQHAHHCLPCSSPLTLHQAHWPTNQVSANKHFYTCPSGKRSLLQCHTGITWRCDSLWTHRSEDEPRALFRNKFSIVVLQQKASVLLTELGRRFVNGILQSCYIRCVITINVVFHCCWGTTSFTRTSFV